MAGASEGVGGGVWESNPPVPTSSRRTGFEDQESHQTLFASTRQYSIAAASAHTTPTHEGSRLPPPNRPFKNSSITPPLRGSRRSPSRMAKASAVGGSHKASQRRDLVRRRGFAPANLQAMADAVGGDRDLPGQGRREDVGWGGAAFTRLQCEADVHYGTPRWPPSGSKTGSALSPTPPQGGSDNRALNAAPCPIPGRVVFHDCGLLWRGCPPGNAGVPPAPLPGTASDISSPWFDPHLRRGSPRALPLRFTPTGRLTACNLTLTLHHLQPGIGLRAGRPRSRGVSLWGASCR